MDALDMVALAPFTYPFSSRDLRPGDSFRAVSDADAQALRLTGLAKPRTQSGDENAAAADQGQRRAYRRRDMTAAQ